MVMVREEKVIGWKDPGWPCPGGCNKVLQEGDDLAHTYMKPFPFRTLVATATAGSGEPSYYACVDCARRVGYIW